MNVIAPTPAGRDARRSPHVVVVGGSERVDGNTDQVIATTTGLLADRRITSTVIQVRELGLVGGCGPCVDCNVRVLPCSVKDGVAGAVATMSAADGVVYATPVHGFGAASLMQSFIERAGVGHLRFRRPLAGKPGLAIVTGRRFAHEQVHAQLVSNMLLNRMVLAGSGFPAILLGGAPGSWRRDVDGLANLRAALDRYAELVWFLHDAADADLHLDGGSLPANERLLETDTHPLEGITT